MIGLMLESMTYFVLQHTQDDVASMLIVIAFPILSIISPLQ